MNRRAFIQAAILTPLAAPLVLQPPAPLPCRRWLRAVRVERNKNGELVVDWEMLNDCGGRWEGISVWPE